MDLEEIVRTLAKEKGIKMEAIYKAIEMSNAGFYKMLRNKTMKVDTLEKIAEILDVPIARFLGSTDTQSKEKDKEIENLKIQIEQLNELVSVYKKLVERYEADDVGMEDKKSAIDFLNQCFNRAEFNSLTEQDKEKVRNFIRDNTKEFNKATNTTFDRYGAGTKFSEEVLIEKLSGVILTFINKKGILNT